MINTEFRSAYRNHVARLEQRLNQDEALRQAIGGEFLAVGKLEYYLLRSLGLADGHLVVDVGCGSGRLACQLAPFSGIDYIGCDVVPALVDYATKLADRRDWQFSVTDGHNIPCADERADYVCFFSVFTHLLHENTFTYIQEAARCLKPGGRLVFSFIEFRIPCHWEIFASSLASDGTDRHLNQFVDRDAIQTWAAHAKLEVRSIHDGDKPHIPIPESISWENGNVMSSMGNLGQSIAVLSKAPRA
jgi:SAM-dependent methyltransferase